MIDGFGSSLLSNMENKDRSLVIEAIKLSGFSNIVYIEDIATYGDGIVLKNYFGLHTTTRKIDHGKFWRMFEELEKKQNENTNNR